MVYKVNINIVI